MFGFLASCALAALLTDAYAAGPAGQVIYNPEQNPPSIFDAVPAGVATSYLVGVTSPANFPAGTSFVPQTTVSLTAGPAAAATYVTFMLDPATVQPAFFSEPNQTLQFKVTGVFPGVTVSTSYAYTVQVTGWPLDSATYTNNGHFVSATRIPPAPDPAGPVVAISTPVNGSSTNVASFPTTFTLNFTATASAPSLISTVSAVVWGPGLNGQSLSVTPSGTLNLGSVAGTAPIPILAPGTYTVQVVATDSAAKVGSASTTFTVTSTGSPPVVSIVRPQAPNNVFTIVPSVSTTVHVPFDFAASGSASDANATVQSVSVLLDGSPISYSVTPSLPATSISGTSPIDMSAAAVGLHTVSVTATNNFNRTATATTQFVIKVLQPAVTITDPDNNEVIEHVIGTPPLNLPFSFTSATTAGFTVDAVSAVLDGTTNLTIDATLPALGTATSAVSTGTITALSAGVHTLRATCTSGGMTVSDTVTFTVVDVPPPPPPPTIQVSTPVATAEGVNVTGSMSDSFAVGTSKTYALSFIGRSYAPGGTITSLAAQVDGGASIPLTLSAAGSMATASGSVTLSTQGAHVIHASITDSTGGTADAYVTISVSLTSTMLSVSGTVFFDANFNGMLDAGETGLAGVPVTLRNAAGQVLANTTTGSDGVYAFPNVSSSLLGTTYEVVTGSMLGLAPTTVNDNFVVVGLSNVTVPKVGYGLQLSAIRNLTAGGFTIGYWKNNVEKAIANKTNGVQVSAANVKKYTSAIANNLALDIYNYPATTSITSIMAGLDAIMSSTSSKPTDLLSKQLVAAEYNFASGVDTPAAYIGGSKPLTYCFIYWGEFTLKYRAADSSYVLFAQQWFNAYNNTHGGVVNGPVP